MQYDFDTIRDRRGSDSVKWAKYGRGVIPLWVADMDFVSAEPILQALHQRVDHGFFGYAQASPELCQAIRDRLLRLYNWSVQDSEIFFLPGLVTGLNLSCYAFAEQGDEILVQTPVYPHFIKDPPVHGRSVVDAPLVATGDTYEIDFDAFERAITPRTKLFIFCNPHNPVGRVYTVKELGKLAEICLRHKLIICSDEIHCDLLYPGFRHIPLATLSPEIAEQMVTLMAPSKTYNLAGLRCGLAIIRNPVLQKRWKTAGQGILPGVDIMGQVAALAAYRHGQDWFDQVLIYLKNNRDFLYQYIEKKLSGIRLTKMEGTYLAWLDCRKTGIPGNPFEVFLREAKVALNDGAEFGRGGEGFVRLNFACPRKTLAEALERMAGALKRL